MQDQYKISEGNNQLVLVLNGEILLPEDAPVRVTSAQLEEMDYRKLCEAYSSKGRISVTDPRVLFKVMAYGYQCDIYSPRKLEEACEYRVDFMWLLENRKTPDHSTLSRFRTDRYAEAAEDLFYQYIQLLEILLSVKAEGIVFVSGKGKHKTKEQREKCCRKQDINGPKEVIMKETLWEKRLQSMENITRERDSLTDESFNSGRGSLWAYKERLWLPQISNNRKEECADRVAVPCTGV